MYKNQTNKVAIRTQKAVAGSFLELLREHAYEDISVTEICRRADIVRKSFYNNFDAKDDVVRYLINDIFYEMESKVNLQHMSVQHALLIAFRFVMENREALMLFYKRGLLRFAYKAVSAYIAKNYIENNYIVSASDKKTPDTRASKYIAAQISAVLISVIETWIENEFEEPVEFMAELTETLIYKP